MFLTEISRFPSFSTLKKPHKNIPNNFDLLSRSFDENLLRRLTALSPPSISLSWLSLAVDFLSLTHSEARALISDLKHSSSSGDASLGLYLDDSGKILDLCNSISSEIERLRLRRLLINFGLDILSISDSDERRHLPPPEKLTRARDSLSGGGNSHSVGIKKHGLGRSVKDLVRDLALGLGDAPRGRVGSAGMLIRRTICAVGLVTVFVAGVMVSTLYGLPELVAVRVPAEFLWADEFNKLGSTVSAELKRRVGGEDKKAYFEDLNDVEARIKEVLDAVDYVAGHYTNKDKLERLNGAVKELKRATETFSEGLDKLSDGVNSVFNTVLCSRDGMLEKMRLSVKDEKSSK